MLFDPAGVAQHLREVEASLFQVLLFPTQRIGFFPTGRITPECVGRNDRVGRLLMDGIP